MIGDVKSEASVVGIITTAASVSGDVTSKTILADVDVGRINIIHTDLPDYDGEYEIFPTIEDQVLDTTLKTMRQDLTVKAVAYEEELNPAGGYTVIIGSRG